MCIDSVPTEAKSWSRCPRCSAEASTCGDQSAETKSMLLIGALPYGVRKCASPGRLETQDHVLGGNAVAVLTFHRELFGELACVAQALSSFRPGFLLRSSTLYNLSQFTFLKHTTNTDFLSIHIHTSFANQFPPMWSMQRRTMPKVGFGGRSHTLCSQGLNHVTPKTEKYHIPCASLLRDPVAAHSSGTLRLLCLTRSIREINALSISKIPFGLHHGGMLPTCIYRAYAAC